MVKIFIDPGHGGYDSGAVGYGLKEKDLTLKIAKKIRDMLSRYSNVVVKLSREDDRYLSLSQRAKMANDWNADIFISIHINSATNKSAAGFETFIYNGNVSQATISNQNVIHADVVKAIGLRDRGKKRANFAVLRQTKMPGLLTENGFISNANDANKLKQESFLNKIAQGHVNGLVKVFGLKPKITNKGVDDMLDKAIVINSFADYPFAESLANKLACPIYTRNIAWGKKVAKTLFVVGGNTKDLKADKFVVLSGSNRFETAEKVWQHIAKL